MENKKLKLTFGIGFLIALSLWLTAPIFAFEGFDVNAIPFYYNPDNYSQVYYQFTDDNSYMTNGFYHSANQTDQGREVGILTGFPVPYYSDGDHYSVFLNFSFSVPTAAFINDWVGIYVRPMSSNVNLTPASGGTWLSVKVNNTTPSGSTGNCDLTQGKFTWQGYADCSYRMLVVSTIDAYSTQYIYNVSLVLDLNLIQGSTIGTTSELRPFSVSAKYYLGYPSSSTSTYGLGLYKDYSIRCTDTSIYGLLEGIQSAVESIDFSGLSDLSTLTTTIENFYESYVSINSTIVDKLEEILDDTEPDEDLTRWAEQQSEINSMNDYLYGIESSYFDALNEFTFPEKPDQTAVGNVFYMFFQNNYILTLIVTAMCIMMVCILLW